MTIQAKPILRLYRMEDEQMQTRAQTMHGNLTIDLAAFQAKFPWIDVTFLDSFQTDITTAKNYQQDAAVVNMLKVLTEDVDSSVLEGAKALDLLDIYARVAYPTSLARQRVFGQDNWEKAFNDQQKMFKALELAFSFANAAPFNADLLNKGMQQTDIDNLNTIAQNIDLKDSLQEQAKSGRPITTEDRIRVNNVVWSRKQIISTCSELVWRDDAAKLEQYQLYPPNEGDLGPFNIQSFTIPPAGSLLVPRGSAPISPLLELYIRSRVGNVIFCATDLPASPCTAGYEALEEVTFKGVITELGLDLSKTHIQVTNPGLGNAIVRIGWKEPEE